MSEPPTLADVRAAAARIHGRVRRTPMLAAQPSRQDLPADVTFKLECLQIAGSFKARGATNKLLTLAPERLAKGLITASGGNHGLGVAYAAWQAKVPATVYLPHSTPPAKASMLRAWGAEVVMHGAVWDDANAAALAAAETSGRAYVHPFDDAAVIAGQGTVALEILEDAPDTDVIMVAIGGGGLISGIALAAKALKPGIRVIGVEPTGAPTLHQSLAAGGLVELERIDTRATTLAPRKSAQINLDLIRRFVDQVVLVSDAEMLEAARRLWSEYAVGAELSAAAGFAALVSGRYGPPPGAKVCVLVCGAGTDGIG
ncbi:MAG TPA: threonine/serine dehydratase [Candidatus Cybelea sp.]|nr:threonine/serine dehydratase [Candidatus Cybelea sp.]